MKIGFDVSQTGDAKAGCGYFADGLIQGLSSIDSKNQYDLYPSFGDHFWPNDCLKTRKITLPNFSRQNTSKCLNDSKLLWSQSSSEIEKKLNYPDIIHSNNFFCPTKLNKTKLVYTLYDLSFLEYPQWTTEANRLACFNGMLSASLYADHLISISEYTKKNFLEVFSHVDEKKISVVYPGQRYEKSSPILKKPSHLPALKTNQFWLNVGTIEPRKNQEGLLRAYALFKGKNKSAFPLVIAGGRGWLIKNLSDLIITLGLEKDVFILNYVSDTELLWLYQNTFSLIYPSFFEGFGLPLLEALSFGKPVISSNTSSLPEVVGDGGILIDPYQPESICDAMFQLERDANFYQKLSMLATQQATKFSWERSAHQTKAIYESF